MSDKDKLEGFNIFVERASCGHYRAIGLGTVGSAVTPSQAVIIWAKNWQTQCELTLTKARMEELPNSKPPDTTKTTLE